MGKYIKARAKVFGVVSEYRFSVNEAGTVRVFDEVAGHYTVCHDISDRVARRIARLAGVVIDRSSPYSHMAVA